MNNIIKEKRIIAGLSQPQMSKEFEIPIGTIANWEQERRECPKYVEKLIIEKLEVIIMKKSNEVLKRALQLLKLNNLDENIPILEVGDIVTINDVWDGNGDLDDILNNSKSYSYYVGDDEDSNCDWNINYEFEVIEEKENRLKTVIKITNINLI